MTEETKLDYLLANLVTNLIIHLLETKKELKMAQAPAKIAPIDLDTSLDDIDDLPGFAALPTGAYNVVLPKGFEVKMVNNSKSVEMAMTVKEVVEIVEDSLDEGESLPKEGDIATMLFQLDNSTGAGLFKQAAAPIRAASGANTLREVIEASKGMELTVIIKRRKGKGENEGRNFMSLVQVSVL
jgi:hypothetical protein